jgi:hypothetical protein
MRTPAVSVLLACCLAVASCSEPASITPPDDAASLSAAASTRGAGPQNFITHLDGSQEVSLTPVVTRASGTAVFNLSPRGDEIRFNLVIRGITNVTMAHIHVAPAGVNGGVVVWLRPSGPPPQLIPGPFNGQFAQGTITKSNLVGSLAGKDLSALVSAMRAGNTYVNVHTSQYPAGEIRGQIRVSGPPSRR